MAIRRQAADDLVTRITSLDADGEYPYCGLELPENGPLVCPRCGAPY